MTWDQILAAIIIVETVGNPHPPDGDKGRSIGPFQISFGYYTDALGFPDGHFAQWADVRDARIASEAVRRYMLKYCPKRLARAQAGMATMKDAEVIARIHNGGPQGWRRRSTDRYWAKVKKELKWRRKSRPHRR